MYVQKNILIFCQGNKSKKSQRGAIEGNEHSKVVCKFMILFLKLIWEERHVWGARRTANMLKDLCGFYIKVREYTFFYFVLLAEF